MARWRYLAQRLSGQGVNEDFLDLDLPLQGVSITDTLSGPSTLTASIAPEVSRLVGPDGYPILQKWGTAIYAEESGQIRAGTILTDRPRDGASLSLSCTGFAGYPQGQAFTDSWFGVKIDPLDVVRKAWDHLQSQPGGNLGVTVDSSTKTPVTIGTELKVAKLDPKDDPNVGPSEFESGPVRLSWYETSDIGQKIDELASSTPFDYRERHAWGSDDKIHHYLDFAYPQFGRRRHDLRFVIGENVAVIPQVAQGEYASDILVIGNGEGRTAVHTVVRGNLGRLRRCVAIIDKSQKSLRGVNALGKEELSYRVGDDDITQIAVRDHPHAPVGAVETGDEILLEGNLPWGPVSFWTRVVSITYQPESPDVQSFGLVRSDRISA